MFRPPVGATSLTLLYRVLKAMPERQESNGYSAHAATPDEASIRAVVLHLSLAGSFQVTECPSLPKVSQPLGSSHICPAHMPHTSKTLLCSSKLQWCFHVNGPFTPALQVCPKGPFSGSELGFSVAIPEGAAATQRAWDILGSVQV